MVDGINLNDLKEFAKVFKLRRLSMGLTQTQVGQALSVTEGPAYSQSAICRSVWLKCKSCLFQKQRKQKLRISAKNFETKSFTSRICVFISKLAAFVFLLPLIYMAEGKEK